MNNFKFMWEKFLNGFDATEEMNAWDKDIYGEMEAYCENILVSTLIRFIAVDGVVKAVEVENMNNSFGFDFSVAEVEEICENMGEELSSFIDNPADMFALIAKANSKIAEEFKALLLEACEIIINSDSFVSSRETNELEEFVANIKNIG